MNIVSSSEFIVKNLLTRYFDLLLFLHSFTVDSFNITIPDETLLTSYLRFNNLELFYILSKKIRVRERESESMPLSPKIAFLVTIAAEI